MDHSYRPQRIHAHASRSDGPSGPLRSEHHPPIASTRPYAQPSRTSSLQSYYTSLNSFTPPNGSSLPNAPNPSSAPTPYGVPTPRHASSNPSPQSHLSSNPSPQSHWSSNTSPHSYHTANPSPMSNFSINTSSTQSSNMSFPYSVTSINSHKSRKNILYPRRAHPPPPPPPPLPLAVPVPAEFSHDVRLFAFCDLYAYRCSYSPSRPEFGSFVHPCCPTQRPVLCLQEKCSSSRWGSSESFRNSCRPRLTKQLATVPSYLSHCAMKFTSNVPLELKSWKFPASFCIRKH